MFVPFPERNQFGARVRKTIPLPPVEPNEYSDQYNDALVTEPIVYIPHDDAYDDTSRRLNDWMRLFPPYLRSRSSLDNGDDDVPDNGDDNMPDLVGEDDVPDNGDDDMPDLVGEDDVFDNGDDDMPDLVCGGEMKAFVGGNLSAWPLYNDPLDGRLVANDAPESEDNNALELEDNDNEHRLLPLTLLDRFNAVASHIHNDENNGPIQLYSDNNSESLYWIYVHM